MGTIEHIHDMSIFTYMMVSGEIQIDTMVFLIEYLDIPVLHQQMYDHLSSVNHTQNIYLCKAIIGTYGFEYPQSIKAFRFLIRATSLPRKFRKHMSIATFYHTDNKQLHDRMHKFIATGRRGKTQVHPYILCQICLHFNFGGERTHCCNQGYHVTCGNPHQVIMNRHVCRFCFKELQESDLQFIHARHQLPQFRRLRGRKHYHSKKVWLSAAELHTVVCQPVHSVGGFLYTVEHCHYWLSLLQRVIADRWEDTPYVVLGQPNPEIPVYDVRRNDPRAKRIRRHHRNLLLPFGVDLTSNGSVPQSRESHQQSELVDIPRYVIPQRRAGSTVSQDDKNSCVDEVPVLRRSARKRNPPKWRTSRDFVY
ncbi:hypothetical protein DPMN_048115 [Dreissena polymorpha]|uniref:Uncharacterized protein n=1 Tax=Dreissena polymorpha TaxID=45954 RepID=A0A9D4DA56_DREPO|nr:hypothetical protein DPMN_048115 [Dreissena polymorpha]